MLKFWKTKENIPTHIDLKQCIFFNNAILLFILLSRLLLEISQLCTIAITISNIKTKIYVQVEILVISIFTAYVRITLNETKISFVGIFVQTVNIYWHYLSDVIFRSKIYTTTVHSWAEIFSHTMSTVSCKSIFGSSNVIRDDASF